MSVDNSSVFFWEDKQIEWGFNQFFLFSSVMMVPTMKHVRLLCVLLMCCFVNAVINPEELWHQLRERLVPVNMTLLQQAVDMHVITLTETTDGLTTTTTARMVGADQVPEVQFSRHVDWHAWLRVNLGPMSSVDL